MQLAVKYVSNMRHGLLKSMLSIGIAVVSLVTVAGGQPAPPTSPEFTLKAESPKFHDLIAPGATLEKVATGFQFTEGPLWDKKGFLYVSDEGQNKIFRVYPDGRTNPFAEIRDPDGTTFDAQGRLIVCASQLRVVAEIAKDGTYKVIADKYVGKKFNSPNDIVLGPDGALYFTDPSLDLPKGDTQELPYQGIFRLEANGALRLLNKEMNQPNGLAFSPDGRKLYVDDTRTREIMVFDVAPNGDLSNRRLFGKQDGPPRSGSADGMKVDRKGNLFVTGPMGVWVWSPEGVHLGTIVMPESPANLAWGGSDGRTLYLTARTSIYRIKTKTQGAKMRVKRRGRAGA
jgi:gluconolactonase